MKNILGIDPGQNGAIALIVSEIKTNGYTEYKPENTDELVLVYDINGSPAFVSNKIKDWKHNYGIDGVIIEKVSAMPGQGSVSMFNFGETCGLLKGICLGLGIPILSEPRPQDWKKRVGIVLCPPKKPKGATKEEITKHKTAVAAYKREQKNVSRNRAAELYPQIAHELSRVKDADRAEAVLLCHYGILEG